MQTTIRSTYAKTAVRTATSNVSSTSVFWKNLEFKRFGLIPILLVIMGCVGGLAAAFGAQADILKLSMIAFPTIIAFALILGVAPMKGIIYVSVIALFLDLIVLIF